MPRPFHSIYTHGFVRAAVCVPPVRVAEPAFNAAQTIALAQRAHNEQAVVALFPEMGISSYAIDDLFHQDALLEATVTGVAAVVEASRELTPVLLVGAPLRFEGGLYNCGVVIYRGRVLGLAPKSYLPNYREFYEKRQFVSARHAHFREVRFLGQTVPFGNDLIFTAYNLPGFGLHVEICTGPTAISPHSRATAPSVASLLWKMTCVQPSPCCPFSNLHSPNFSFPSNAFSNGNPTSCAAGRPNGSRSSSPSSCATGPSWTRKSG